MNVPQLRYLVAVSDCGSVSAASRTLGVTQPVVSRAVHAFEAEQGVTVFERSGRRLVVTEAGQPIVHAARDALAAFDAVEHAAQGMREAREFVVATTPTNGLLLTEALGELHRAVPALVIRVSRADDADHVVRLVQEGGAELGFSELTPLMDESPLTVVRVAELDVVLVSPMGTDLPAAVTWNDVVTQPLIVPPPDSQRRALINAMSNQAAGTTPRETIIFEDRGSWLAAAQAGMGSFLSYRRLADDYERVELRAFLPAQRVPVGFVRHDVEPTSEVARLIALAEDSLIRTVAVAATE